MIQKLSYDFDLKRLQTYFEKVRSHECDGQISLRFRKGFEPFTDGLGSALDPNHPNQLLYSENLFTELVDGSENPISDIIETVKQIAKSEYQLGIGRIRFMTQMPKTCLSYHRDVEKYRFHIPLVTNSNCFFVIDDQVYRMPTPGVLHTLRVDKLHTSINANKDFLRTHLVFTTFNL